MKRPLSVLLLLPLLLGAQVVLTDGVNTIPVVIPEKRTHVQNTAVNELTDHLQQITGLKFRTVVDKDTVKGPAIYLGGTRKAKAFTPAGLKPEEWIVRTSGKDLIITGGVPRGTLFGIYHFLEDVLGVRWLSPTVTHIPRRKEIKLGNLNMRGCPAFAQRTIYQAPGNAFRARNRMSVSSINYGGQMNSFYSRGPAAGGCHTMYSVIGKPAEIRALFKKHPEYFPLVKGRRHFDSVKANGGAQSQFCLTNPDLRKLWVESLRKHIRYDKAYAKKYGQQLPMFYAVDQNDCYDGFCNCPACNAITEREGGRSGLMLDFVNHIAKELEQEAPWALFRMMALHSTEKPPKHMKARHNVAVQLCDTTSNMVKPWSHKVNTKHRTNLEKWAKVCKNITMWDYSINYGSISCINYPFPSARTYAPDLQMLKKNNGCGIFFEHEQIIGADMRDLKIWMEFKLAENPFQDYETLLKDFTDHYFGKKAAVKIREYLKLLGDAADKSNVRIGWYTLLSDFSYITADVMIQAAKLFDEAEKLAENKVYVSRVEYARLSLDRLMLIRNNTYRKAYALQKKDLSLLPDAGKVKARYQRVWKRALADLKNPKVRNSSYIKSEISSNLTQFITLAESHVALPHPEKFKDVKKDALFLFNVPLSATVYVNYYTRVPDPETPVGRALCASMKKVESTVHKKARSLFSYPFNWAVWPSM
ncbi:MAG: DUF4838 domain-containing protein, partial [Lentisphaeria bacterium]|nr:DUF4838 domain-containing protein [Lentisphaeria bacterium]